MADAKIKPADPKETSVAVKGLAPSATEATIATLFAAQGKLLRVKLDKHGGAHVVFSSTRAAQRAALAANGAIVDGQTISAQHVRAFGKTTRPCRSFQEGKCRKGDQCKYWHPPMDGSSVTTVKVPTVVAAAAKKSKPAVATVAASGDDISGIPKASICRNFAKGNCLQGTACRFAHVLGAGPLPPPTPASIPAQCSFFLAGRCTKGDDCAFLHTNTPPPPPSSKPSMCSFFAAGRCARGDQCAYVHETKPGQAAPVAKRTVVATKAVAPVAVATPATVVKPAKKVVKKAVTPVVATATVDSDRTCIECEKPGVATWVCAGCDNAKYCDECKTMVHRPKVMRSHTQEPLPALATTPVCGECEENASAVECADCAVPYCESCDASVHQFKSLRNHTRTPVQVVQAAAPPQPKKVKVETKAKPAPVAAAAVATPATYVDSVPQLDLPSDSESSDEDDDEDEKPSAIIQTNKQEESSSESEEDEDDEEADEQPAAAALAGLSYVESVPKYDLPSESESDEEEEDDDNDSVEDAKQAIVEAAFVAVKQKTSPVKRAPVTELSSESESDSDDDSFEDERPVVAKPAAPVAAARPAVKTAIAMEISSESESDSDDDDVPPVKKTPTAVAAPKRKAESSSDSESDSSDDDARPPAAKQARVAAPVAAAKTVTKAPVNQKPGISTGSNHSLVKKIEAYEAGDSSEVLHLDPNLNGFERLLAHDCAERLGLHHVSVGEGLERHITISRKGGGDRMVGQKAKRS